MNQGVFVEEINKGKFAHISPASIQRNTMSEGEAVRKKSSFETSVAISRAQMRSSEMNFGDDEVTALAGFEESRQMGVSQHSAFFL